MKEVSPMKITVIHGWSRNGFMYHIAAMLAEEMGDEIATGAFRLWVDDPQT